MSEWVDVAPATELPPGSRRVVDVDNVQIAVFNLDGGYYAIEDACTHDGGELASGTCEGDVIICPRHGARFPSKPARYWRHRPTNRSQPFPCVSSPAWSRCVTIVGIELPPAPFGTLSAPFVALPPRIPARELCGLG